MASSGDYYPIILTPHYYNQLMRSEYSFKDLFPGSKEPLLPIDNFDAYLSNAARRAKAEFETKLKEQRNYYKTDELTTSDKIVAYLLYGALLAFLISIRQYFSNGFFWVIFVPVSILGYYLTIPLAELIKSYFTKENKRAIDQEIQNFKKRFKLSNDEVVKAELDFHNQLAEYRNVLDAYNQNCDDCLRPEYVLEHKRKQFSSVSLIKSELIFSIARESENRANIGLTEDFFADFIAKQNEYKILRHFKCGYYYPDIILFDKRTNVVVDIEIDEPYSLNDKVPIHFDNEDMERDMYFTDLGFLVVRFSENQVFNYPEECYKVLKNCIIGIAEMKDYKDFVTGSNDFMNFKDKCWTKEDAKKMALQGSRNEISKRLLQFHWGQTETLQNFKAHYNMSSIEFRKTEDIGTTSMVADTPAGKLFLPIETDMSKPLFVVVNNGKLDSALKGTLSVVNIHPSIDSENLNIYDLI
jgi:very-short-patch-repair endonuclease